MAHNSDIQPQNAGLRYEAVLRLGEALSACAEPEEITKILCEQLRDVLNFIHFYIVVYRENSSEIEWAVLGQERNLIAVYLDVPVQERPSWRVYATQEPFYIEDISADERIPARLKQNLADQGIKQDPLVFVPLTTPQRRLGALGMSGQPGVAYSNDDISFLRLVGRVVAFAIDDNLNLKRAEAANAELQHQNELLQRSERELREVIETIPCMAWSAAADGTAQFFNRRWLEYTGLSADQVENWGWTIAVHSDDLPTLVHYWRTILTSGESGEIETRLRRCDGVYRWFLFRATPSLDGNGKVVKWYGTNIDIEEHKTAEAALKRSEAYLAEAQKLAHTGSCAIDGASHEIVYWSEEMFRLFDFDPQQGLPEWDEWVQRIHPEDREKFRMAGDRTFFEKINCDVEFRTLTGDGAVKHIHGIGHPVLSPTGELLQVVGTMVDITERKCSEEARERLRQLEADLAHITRVSTMGELTASLAHEIKQPIGAAATNAEACMRLLDRAEPDIDEAREAALEMTKDARRAAEIIERVRSLYQKCSSQLERIEVNGVIGEMVVMLQNEADRHSVTISTNLAEGLPAVMADRVQIQQVLLNLTLNGIEAIRDSSGEVRVESRLNGDAEILICVTDTGMGLPADNTDQIFNPFFTTKSRGTGLGLAITRSIIESHGGRIWATPNSGRGTTLSFTLPRPRSQRLDQVEEGSELAL